VRGRGREREVIQCCASGNKVFPYFRYQKSLTIVYQPNFRCRERFYCNGQSVLIWWLHHSSHRCFAIRIRFIKRVETQKYRTLLRPCFFVIIFTRKSRHCLFWRQKTNMIFKFRWCKKWGLPGTGWPRVSLRLVLLVEKITLLGTWYDGLYLNIIFAKVTCEFLATPPKLNQTWDSILAVHFKGMPTVFSFSYTTSHLCQINH